MSSWKLRAGLGGSLSGLPGRTWAPRAHSSLSKSPVWVMSPETFRPSAIWGCFSHETPVPGQPHDQYLTKGNQAYGHGNGCEIQKRQGRSNKTQGCSWGRRHAGKTASEGSPGHGTGTYANFYWSLNCGTEIHFNWFKSNTMKREFMAPKKFPPLSYISILGFRLLFNLVFIFLCSIKIWVILTLDINLSSIREKKNQDLKAHKCYQSDWDTVQEQNPTFNIGPQNSTRTLGTVHELHSKLI